MEERFPNLTRAPIHEALIDLQVELPPATTIETLAKIQARVAEGYPTIQTRFKVEGKFQFLPGPSIAFDSAGPGPDGMIFISADERQIFQARLDGFTFSRLKPYKNWGHLFGEARRLWAIYHEEIRPIHVRRVASRFINRLEFPLPVRDFGDYLTALPPIPPRLPQERISFLSRLTIAEPSIEGRAVITQALEGFPTGKSVGVVLDIDVFLEKQFAPEAEELWDLVARFQRVKNRLFFESITEKCVEMFQ